MKVELSKEQITLLANMIPKVRVDATMEEFQAISQKLAEVQGILLAVIVPKEDKKKK